MIIKLSALCRIMDRRPRLYKQLKIVDPQENVHFSSYGVNYSIYLGKLETETRYKLSFDHKGELLFIRKADNQDDWFDVPLIKE